MLGVWEPFEAPVAAQHLEGGPEAQLYVQPLDLELIGSYETGFFALNDNIDALPIPNIIGVILRAQP